MKLTPEIQQAISSSEWWRSYDDKNELEVSPSSLLGADCQTKFLLSRVLRLELKDQDTSKMDLGKAFHAYLETGQLPEDASQELHSLCSTYDAKRDQRLLMNEHEKEFRIDVGMPIDYDGIHCFVHGFIDAIGTYDGVPCVIEHKLTGSTNISSFLDTKCRSNQALAYCYATGLRTIVFNVIQRTKYAVNVVTRLHQITDDEVEEWLEEVIDMCQELLDNAISAVHNGFTSVNRDLCHQPYNCQFCDFCKASLQNKNNILTSIYKTKEQK